MYKFCPNCGGALRDNKIFGADRLVCCKCDFIFYQNPIAAVAVIIIQDNEVLLVLRKGSYAGMWCIPCGFVEWSEDVRDAAIREVKEETGLDVEVNEVFAVYSNFHNPDLHTVGIWFLGNIVGGSLIAGDDAITVKFFPLNDLPENLAFATDKKVLTEIVSSLGPTSTLPRLGKVGGDKN